MDPRILFVNHSSRLAGAEFVLRDIVQAFDKPGVFLFEDGPFRQMLENGNSVIMVAKPASKNLNKVKRDSNLLKTAIPLAGTMALLVKQIVVASKRYDIVYANSQKAFILSALASVMTRKPLIWHCHDILSKDHFSASQIRLDVLLAKQLARRVIFPSFASAEAFVASGGPLSITRVLYGGVSPLENKHRDKRALRNELGLPHGFLYGVFSRLAPWKGQHVAIEALKYVPEAKCIIVGDSQFGEREYADYLRNYATQLGISDRVIFLGHRNDVPIVMNAMDAYCHPSTSPEPFGLSILEAMRAELPVVATNAGGIVEIIEPNVTGLLVNVNDPIGLANALKLFMVQPNTVVDMVREAKKLVSSKFTIDQMQKNVQSIVDESYNGLRPVEPDCAKT